MAITSLTRNILIYSVVIVVCFAVIFLAFVWFRVHKIRKTIRKNNLDIISNDSIIEGHQRVMNRNDLGEPIFELRNAVHNPLDDEIVEFTINTIIKNKFKNILMLDYKTTYEIIAISNKTNTTINVLSNEFNEEEYGQIKNTLSFDHKLNVLEKINHSDKFDLITLLSSKTNYSFVYEQYIDNLSEKGMFLIANVNKNKPWKTEIIKKINQKNIKYDILKWYKGFILIVK